MTLIKYLLLIKLFSMLVPSTIIGQMESSADKITIKSYLSVDNIHPGSTFYAAIELDIDETWHINAHIPTFDYLIGTELVFEEIDDFEIVDIKYPEPKQYTFAFAGDGVLDVYSGEVYIYLKISTGQDISPGEYTFKGELTMQACDDEVCLAPSTKEIRIPISVVNLDKPVQKINRDIFTEEAVDGLMGKVSEPKEADDENVAALVSLFDERGTFIAFLVIFMFGLALNLTPCIYPMLTVTVSVFGAQTDTNMARVFSRAVVYVLGIATMYSVLGVVAALTGGLFGGVLQSSAVLIGIGILFFLLALSMFGLYEIQVPYWLSKRISGTNAAGIFGIYVSGLVVGIFAAPCIGPPIIALLTLVGQKADPVFGFTSFFVLSLGLGLPYLILGTFSGLLSKLPKSGSWMDWVKKVFGIVLISVGIFYLSLAFNPQLIFTLIPACLIIGGLYLGFIERTSTGTVLFAWIKRGVGVAAITGGVWFFITGLQPSLEWEEYSTYQLEKASSSNQSVMLYFYADWCIPCIELDRMSFSDEQFISKSNDLVPIKVDMTRYDSPESEVLRREYNVSGVPTIIFLDGNSREVADTRVVGYVPADVLIEKVSSVKQH